MNKVLVAGEVVAVDDTTVKILTIAHTPNRTFENEYTVHFDDGTPDLMVGERQQILGKFDKDLDNPNAIRIVGIESRDYGSQLDMNIARVSGIVSQSLIAWDPIAEEKKRAFSEILLIVEGSFYVRGAVLRAPAVVKLERSGKILQGAEVQMEGRLNTRNFESNGVKQERLEMVLDAPKTLVLKEAPSDPFEAFNEESTDVASAI